MAGKARCSFVRDSSEKPKSSWGGGEDTEPSQQSQKEKLDVKLSKKNMSQRRCGSEARRFLPFSLAAAQHVLAPPSPPRFRAAPRAPFRLPPRRPPGRLTALPSAQAQAGTRGGGRSGDAPRPRSASRAVSQCSHVWRREAARRARSAAPSVRRRRRTSGGGGHSCRRAGISAADS